MFQSLLKNAVREAREGCLALVRPSLPRRYRRHRWASLALLGLGVSCWIISANTALIELIFGLASWMFLGLFMLSVVGLGFRCRRFGNLKTSPPAERPKAHEMSPDRERLH